MFVTGMLGTGTQRKVLRVLAEKNKRYTIEDLAELCHRSEASVSRALRHADRYPFLERGRVPGSKQLTFRLDPESRYAAAIRDVFEVEYDQERHNGTVPVDIWNLLEDVTERLDERVGGFVELFLFGSYAAGDYYAGSDIDLLLVHTGDGKETDEAIDGVVSSVEGEPLQVLEVAFDESEVERLDDMELMERVVSRAPVSGVDVLIPLSGEVSL